MSISRIPKYISIRYVDGARGFKAEKRRQLRLINAAIKDLRLGCAFFPGGEEDVCALGKIVDGLTKELSVKNWGR